MWGARCRQALQRIHASNESLLTSICRLPTLVLRRQVMLAQQRTVTALLEVVNNRSAAADEQIRALTQRPPAGAARAAALQGEALEHAMVQERCGRW